MKTTITWEPRYATYLAGSDNEDGALLIANSSGSVFIVGNTNSKDFPVTASAYDTTFNGGGEDGYGGDAYVAKINADGSALDFATFVGGSQRENHTYFAAADELGNVYVAGQTASDDFPTTPGAFDNDYNQNKDVFVFKLNPTGTELLYATYLGGSGTEAPLGIAIDEAGNVYVAGRTNSPDLPTTISVNDESPHEIRNDIYFGRFDPARKQMEFAAYLGGTGDDTPMGIVVDSAGNIYIGGSTASDDFPVTQNAFQQVFSKGRGGHPFIVSFPPLPPD